MRTIKFRGKNINKNEWVNGDLVVVEDGMHNVVRAEIITHCFAKSFQGGGFDHYSISTLVKPETIGQFTGLLDKEGKEIYEGDIIVSNKGLKGVITWSCNNASFQIELRNTKPVCGVFNASVIKDFEIMVVCNIHDNPELLKNND